MRVLLRVCACLCMSVRVCVCLFIFGVRQDNFHCPRYGLLWFWSQGQGQMLALRVRPLRYNSRSDNCPISTESKELSAVRGFCGHTLQRSVMQGGFTAAIVGASTRGDRQECSKSRGWQDASSFSTELTWLNFKRVFPIRDSWNQHLWRGNFYFHLTLKQFSPSILIIFFQLYPLVMNPDCLHCPNQWCTDYCVF